MKKAKEDILFNNINQLFETKFKHFEDKFEHFETKIENRIGNIETLIQKIQIVNTKSNSEFNFTSIEDKIQYLNENIKHIDNDIFLFIKDKIIFRDIDIANIISKKQNMLSVISEKLYNINKESSNKNKTQFLYTYAFQKNTIYFWNQDKTSWDKLTTVLFKELIEKIQKIIINKYNEYISKNDNIDFIEIGEYFYMNLNDKKVNDTKKLLFQKFND